MTEEKKVEEPTNIEKLDNPHAAAIHPLKLNAISFINPVLGWFLSHWKITLFLIMCLIIFVQFELIKHYKEEAAVNDTVISTLRDSIKTANQALADQNQKIKDASKQNADKQAQLDALEKKLKNKDKADQKKIDDLRNKPIGTTCEDALRFMDEYIGAGKWTN